MNLNILIKFLKKKYKLNVKLVNASKLFLSKLKNISNPEKKRKIIGNLFIKVFEKESKKYDNLKFLAQGTLYPDIIESKSSTGSKTSKIKSHHNVGGLPKRMNLRLVEPLKDFLGPLWDEWSSYEIDEWTRVLNISTNVPCNWKVIQDNFCESYHLPTVHPQLADSHEENYAYTQFDTSTEGHNRMIMMGATPSRGLRGENPNLPAPLAERMEYWELDPTDFTDRVFDVRLALQKKMRELGSMRGHSHYANLRDAQLTDSHHYNLFPNCSLTFSADGVLLQRMRPDPSDPQKCLFDHWYYTKNTEIADSATNIELTDTSDLQDVIQYGEQSMGLIPDQDIAISIMQQLGLRSRGYRGGYLSGQESRIRRFHDVIDSYIEE